MQAQRLAVLGLVACGLGFAATGAGVAWADVPAGPQTPPVGGSGSVIAAGPDVGVAGAGAPAVEVGVGVSTVGTGETPTASATAVPVQQDGTPVEPATDGATPAQTTASAGPTTGTVDGAPVDTGSTATSTAMVSGTTPSAAPPVTVGAATLVVKAHRTRRHTRTGSTATIDGGTRAGRAQGPPPPGVSAYGGRVEVGTVRASSRSEGGPKQAPRSRLSLHVTNLRVHRAGGGRRPTLEVTDATLRHRSCAGRHVAEGTICARIRVRLRDGQVTRRTLALPPGADLMDPRTYRGTPLATAFLHLYHELEPLTGPGGALEGLQLRIGLQQRSSSARRSSARLTALLIAVKAQPTSAREARLFGLVRIAVASVASAAKGAKAIAQKAGDVGRTTERAIAGRLFGPARPAAVLPRITIQAPRKGLHVRHGAVTLTLTCSQPVAGTLQLSVPSVSSELARAQLDCRPGAAVHVRVRLSQSLRDALRDHTDVPVKVTLAGATVATTGTLTLS